MTIPIGNVPQIPFLPVAGGLRTELGTFTPPGGQVMAYVHSSGSARLTDITAATTVPPVYKTLNDALRLCRSGYGDTVLVLPGHTENISVANQMSNLVAGTRIIGLGNGTNRPTFTWTAAAASFLLNVANVRLEHLILNMDPGTGTVNVAAPMTISAAGCQIVNCQIRMGTDANSMVTIGITTTAGATDLVLDGLDIYAATASTPTTLIQFVGATRLRMRNSSVVGATSAVGVGVVRFLTTASTFIKVHNCEFKNNKASCTAAVTGMAGVSGEADFVRMSVQSGGLAAWGTVASMTFGPNVTVTNADGNLAAPLKAANTLS